MRILSDEEVTLLREINAMLAPGQELLPAYLDRIRAVYIPEGQAVVKSEDLEKWVTKIREANQFKADAETDIGYLAETVYNLQNIGDPMKLVGKLLTGRLDTKGLGLDTDRMAAIAQKYAPLKFAELKKREEESKNKKK